MKNFFQKKNILVVASSTVLSVLMVATVTFASTTINTNINTGGTLDVTGATTLSSTLAVTGATTLSSTLGVTGLTTMVYASSTTMSLTGSLLVNGFATTTSAGNISTQGTLTVVGLTTLGYASTTGMSLTKNLMVNGYATTTSAGAFSTESTVTVGNAGSAVNNVVYGYCTIAADTSVAASSTATVACTATVSGGGTLDTSHKVFVQSTTTIPVSFHIQAASSTSASNIAIELSNDHSAASATFSSIPVSLNFFAIR